MSSLSVTQALEEYPTEIEEEKNAGRKAVVGFLLVEGCRHAVKTGDTKIGRDSSQCSVILNNKNLSKVHAVIESAGPEDTFIYDAGSMNKTRLGKLILKPKARYRIQNNESITFGNVTAKFIVSNDLFHTESCESQSMLSSQFYSDRDESLTGSDKADDLYHINDSIFEVHTQCQIDENATPKRAASKNNSLEVPTASPEFKMPSVTRTKLLKVLINRRLPSPLSNHAPTTKSSLPKDKEQSQKPSEEESIFDVLTQCQLDTKNVSCSKSDNVSMSDSYDSCDIFEVATQCPISSRANSQIKDCKNQLSEDIDNFSDEFFNAATQLPSSAHKVFYKSKFEETKELCCDVKIKSEPEEFETNCISDDARSLLSDGEDDLLCDFMNMNSPNLTNQLNHARRLSLKKEVVEAEEIPDDIFDAQTQAFPSANPRVKEEKDDEDSETPDVAASEMKRKSPNGGREEEDVEATRIYQNDDVLGSDDDTDVEGDGTKEKEHVFSCPLTPRSLTSQSSRNAEDDILTQPFPSSLNASRLEEDFVAIQTRRMDVEDELLTQPFRQSQHSNGPDKNDVLTEPFRQSQRTRGCREDGVVPQPFRQIPRSRECQEDEVLTQPFRHSQQNRVLDEDDILTQFFKQSQKKPGDLKSNKGSHEDDVLTQPFRPKSVKSLDFITEKRFGSQQVNGTSNVTLRPLQKKTESRHPHEDDILTQPFNTATKKAVVESSDETDSDLEADVSTHIYSATTVVDMIEVPSSLESEPVVIEDDNSRASESMIPDVDEGSSEKTKGGVDVFPNVFVNKNSCAPTQAFGDADLFAEPIPSTSRLECSPTQFLSDPDLFEDENESIISRPRPTAECSPTQALFSPQNKRPASDSDETDCDVSNIEDSLIEARKTMKLLTQKKPIQQDKQNKQSSDEDWGNLSLEMPSTQDFQRSVSERRDLPVFTTPTKTAREMSAQGTPRGLQSAGKSMSDAESRQDWSQLSLELPSTPDFHKTVLEKSSATDAFSSPLKRPRKLDLDSSSEIEPKRQKNDQEECLRDQKNVVECVASADTHPGRTKRATWKVKLQQKAEEKDYKAVKRKRQPRKTQDDHSYSSSSSDELKSCPTRKTRTKKESLKHSTNILRAGNGRSRNLATSATSDTSETSEKSPSDLDFPNSDVRVVFTGLEDDALDQIIQRLGGQKTNDLHAGHVMVADKVRRTVKFLSAVALGLPIVSPEWLMMSSQLERFVDPWDFLLQDVEAEERWGFDLRKTLETSRKSKLLQGYSVFATEHAKPPVPELLTIVQCCGGTPMADRPEVWPEKSIVVTCLEDKKSWPLTRFRYVKIVHYEFILSGVLKHVVDFRTHKLR